MDTGLQKGDATPSLNASVANPTFLLLTLTHPSGSRPYYEATQRHQRYKHFHKHNKSKWGKHHHHTSFYEGTGDGGRVGGGELS